MSKDMEDYLTEGIAGPFESKPDERKKFLGTIRERVVVALTQKQVRQNGMYKEEFDHIMKKHPKSKMFLNGNMEYRALSPYIKLAKTNNIPFTLTVNAEYNSDLGLLLAYDHAIDQENILLKLDKERDENDSDGEFEVQSGFRTFLDRLF